ncbi:MAG: GDP-mannose 4,6-dehydratase [Hyphomicrobium sp.]
MLEAARKHKTPRFVHISTDEVYGSIEAPHEATEESPRCAPRVPIRRPRPGRICWCFRTSTPIACR